MGNTASKAARSTRKYPTTASPSISNRPTPIPRSTVKASSTRDAEISRDAQDPDFSPPTSAFAQRLRTLGAVKPMPTHSPSAMTAQPPTNYPTSTSSSSSTSSFPQTTAAAANSPAPTNPSLLIFHSRTRLAREAEAEFEAATRGGIGAPRKFLDAGGVRAVVEMVGKGRGGEVEGEMGVDPVVVWALGRGVVGVSDVRRDAGGGR
ncbi:hypothetical protein VC83_03310 [Pseudogymnoascus destructans]|uniref:Uncharacterized protein n=1 Tax=Pseudogymnoascus destructans TaxID=655981 RepID=A0A177AHI7_9PEZI|nr:uncharacterized protein VC83_03310 [Pseudogymnoascus destructans]OAF60741.1 hypothetical protein VC83_03310 [Pseudogymnoascus destructans]